MVLVVQRWTKIIDQLQNMINAQVPQNSKTCKDKWNGLHSNYKKIAYYHKGIDHNTSYWELVVDECDKFHLPRQFGCEFYEAIDMFQGKKNVNKPIHVKDLQASGNVNYITSIAKSQEDQELVQPQRTFMHKILGDDYVADEQIVNDGNDTILIR